ncbi:hypothetical protein KY308_04065, partial [Candidatus Woesearchaeota archaeon]|nr:hypothetical protein [Candidatus Woesearchaeota archaeon]
MKPYFCLGIESTAHTFGAAVVSSDGKILSNERKLFTTESGGIVPNQAAEHHAQNCDEIIKKALQKAKKKIKDINLVSFSQSPGIGSVLQIGAVIARSIALQNKIPIV